MASPSRKSMYGRNSSRCAWPRDDGHTTRGLPSTPVRRDGRAAVPGAEHPHRQALLPTSLQVCYPRTLRRTAGVRDSSARADPRRVLSDRRGLARHTEDAWHAGITTMQSTITISIVCSPEQLADIQARVSALQADPYQLGVAFSV